MMPRCENGTLCAITWIDVEGYNPGQKSTISSLFFWGDLLEFLDSSLPGSRTGRILFTLSSHEEKASRGLGLEMER